MSDEKAAVGQRIWEQGETKAVGMAFVVGLLTGASQGDTWGQGVVYGFTVWFSLWFIVALAQIFVRGYLVAQTARLAADLDGGTVRFAASVDGEAIAREVVKRMPRILRDMEKGRGR